MPVIHVVEYHDQVFQLWRDAGTHGRRVLHLDFHCDMRGLLIDRKAQLAYPIWERHPKLGEGNFLKHAVLEGMVRGIRWVHDEPGGRQYDLQTVKYTTDATALLHRLAIGVGAASGLPLDYAVLPNSDWRGIEENEVLDIDWDFFACQRYSAESVERRVTAFFAKDFTVIPDETYICYSPGYSHSTRPLFHRFVRKLADRFGAAVVEVAAPPRRDRPRSPFLHFTRLPFFRVTREIHSRAGLALRKRNIY